MDNKAQAMPDSRSGTLNHERRRNSPSPASIDFSHGLALQQGLEEELFAGSILRYTDGKAKVRSRRGGRKFLQGKCGEEGRADSTGRTSLPEASCLPWNRSKFDREKLFQPSTGHPAHLCRGSRSCICRAR
ncbi:hypothetical protein HDV57DRAFT_296385 [Trichoderma longibrachiatum]